MHFFNFQPTLLVSALNLDVGFQAQFTASTAEVSYGSQRLLYQDDTAKLSPDLSSAQAGNDKVSIIMKQKQLKLNLDKTVFIVAGRNNRIQEIQLLLKENPLTIDGKAMKQKLSEKYLGEIMWTPSTCGESVGWTLSY